MRFKMVPTTVILRQGVVVGSLFLAMLFRMIVRYMWLINTCKVTALNRDGLQL